MVIKVGIRRRVFFTKWLFAVLIDHIVMLLLFCFGYNISSIAINTSLFLYAYLFLVIARFMRKKLGLGYFHFIKTRKDFAQVIYKGIQRLNVHLILPPWYFLRITCSTETPKG